MSTALWHLHPPLHTNSYCTESANRHYTQAYAHCTLTPSCAITHTRCTILLHTHSVLHHYRHTYTVHCRYTHTHTYCTSPLLTHILHRQCTQTHTALTSPPTVHAGTYCRDFCSQLIDILRHFIQRAGTSLGTWGLMERDRLLKREEGSCHVIPDQTPIIFTLCFPCVLLSHIQLYMTLQFIHWAYTFFHNPENHVSHRSDSDIDQAENVHSSDSVSQGNYANPVPPHN